MRPRRSSPLGWTLETHREQREGEREAERERETERGRERQREAERGREREREAERGRERQREGGKEGGKEGGRESEREREREREREKEKEGLLQLQKLPRLPTRKTKGFFVCPHLITTSKAGAHMLMNGSTRNLLLNVTTFNKKVSPRHLVIGFGHYQWTCFKCGK